MWQRLWRELRPQDESEEAADLRGLYARTALRMAAAFALLFGGVFFAFWWSGSAIRFGAARAADKATPSWRVTGIISNSVTGDPIAWAVVEDDPAGRPPFFRTEADHAGAYELFTLAEPHRIRVTARGFQQGVVEVGRAWFLWMPKGQERVNIQILPVNDPPK